MNANERCEPPPEWQDETPPEAWGDEYESCPFCGSVEIRPWTDDKTGNHMMWCYTCGADGPLADNDADAEERWNRRVTPPATVAALVEALEECADDLEAEISSRYSAVRHYASMAADEKRDMEPVIRARAALAAYREAGR